MDSQLVDRVLNHRGWVVVALIAVAVAMYVAYLSTRRFDGGLKRAQYIITRAGPNISPNISFEGYRRLVPDLDAVEYRALKSASRSGDLSAESLAQQIA